MLNVRTVYLNVRLEVVSHRIYFLELVPVLLKSLLRLRLKILLRGEVVCYHFFHAPSVLQFLLQTVVVLGQEAKSVIDLAMESCSYSVLVTCI